MPKSKISKLNRVVKKLNDKIEKDNANFEAMTPAQKRVQIAKDVLAQLDSKRLTAESGTWLASDTPIITEQDYNNKAEVKTALQKVKQCTGCALGGLFLCAVERADKLRVSHLKGIDKDNNAERCSIFEFEEEDLFSYLKSFFTPKQLAMIEYTFEHGNGAMDSLTLEYDFDITFEQIAEMDDFLDDLIDDELDSNAELRMRLIMENIVANKGTFKPNIKPVRVVNYQTLNYK